MAIQKGRAILLEVAATSGASPTAYQTLGGIRAKSVSFNAAGVDVTSADSENAWREILAGAGVKSAAVSGAGLFKDEVADATLRQIFFDGDIRKWRLTIPDFGTVTGFFHVSSLEYGGEHDGEVTYEIALESAGALTFAAL